MGRLSVKEVYQKLDEMHMMYSKMIDITESFKSRFDRIDDLENRLREVMMGTHLVTLINEIKDNARKLNGMINEQKGVVSMSRAALNEGKSFTEMLEMPRLLCKFSEELARLEEYGDHLFKVVDKLQWTAFTQEEHAAIIKKLVGEPVVK